MRGSISRRGRASWRIRFALGCEGGTRKVFAETVHGTKRDAQDTLAKRLAETAGGDLVTRSALTVAAYAHHWLETIAPARNSAKTRERFGQLIEKHIVPRIGSVELQKLDGPAIDRFYAGLSSSGRIDGKGGLSPQTVQHIHRLLYIRQRAHV